VGRAKFPPVKIADRMHRRRRYPPTLESARRRRRGRAAATSMNRNDESGGDRRVAVGLVLTGIASVQFGSALATQAFGDVGPGGTVFLRTAFAAIVLVALWRPALDVINRSTARDIVLFGVTLAMMNLCFYQALDRLPLGIAVTLEFVGPLGVAIAGSRSRLDVLWVVLAAAGILLLGPDIGDGLDPVGVGFALGAGAFWGGYILMSARVGRGPTGFGGLAVAMVVATVILIPIGVIDGGTGLLAPATLAIGLGVAVLSSAIPYTVELEALRRLPERTFGVMLSLEPAAAALVGVAVLNQDLVGREIVAIALVMIASAGALSSAGAVEAPQA
jgi:inner membrane transporter RhtA